MKAIEILTALELYKTTNDSKHLDELGEKAQKEIETAEIKKRGGNSQLARQRLAEKILKDNAKNTTREKALTATDDFFNGEQLQFIFSTFYGVAFRGEYRANVETQSAKVKQFNPSNMFRALENTEKVEYNANAIQINLETWKRSDKSIRTATPYFEHKKYSDRGFNCKMFLELVKALTVDGETPEFYQNTQRNGASYLVSKAGYGIIMPINLNIL